MRILLAATAPLLLAGSANAATIVNGSFENGTFTGAGFDTLAAGNTNITGWTIGGAGIDWIGSFWQASNGNRSIDLSAVSAGSLSQTFATVAGTRYTVSFDLSGNPSGGPNPKIVDVAINGGPATGFAFLTGTNTNANMQWAAQSYSFTALTASSTLSFTSNAFTPSGPALDNVAISTVVPEPASWAMLIAGFGLVGVAARRRRNAVPA